MLSDSIKKVKEWAEDNKKDLILAGIIFFTGLSSFGLGRLSVDIKPPPPIRITDMPIQGEGAGALKNEGDTEKKVVASRNGSTYYYSWCAGVKRIKEENRIWFATKDAAERAGLRQAANCGQ